MSSKGFRTERDSMGELQVPEHALWGAQTQRAVDNFPISGLTMPRQFIRALGLVKWACAGANSELGILPTKKAMAIQEAAQEVADHRVREAVAVLEAAVLPQLLAVVGVEGVEQALRRAPTLLEQRLQPGTDAAVGQADLGAVVGAHRVARRGVEVEVGAPLLHAVVAGQELAVVERLQRVVRQRRDVDDGSRRTRTPRGYRSPSWPARRPRRGAAQRRPRSRTGDGAT